MKIKINNRICSGREGWTILEAARQSGFDVPSLCYHPDLSIKANCRICVVEVKGRSKLVPACSTLISAGMEIYTDSPRVRKARQTNLELLFASHAEKCGDCSAHYDCDLLSLAKRYKLSINSFPDRKKNRPVFRFAQAVEIDGTQCIDCGNCVEACQKQGIGYLHFVGHGADQEIRPVKDKNKSCIYCGQCANACPVAAAQEQAAWPTVEKALRDPKKIVVAQFAPAVRVAIGEEFGLLPGENCEGKIYAALHKLGFKHSFDVNFAADVTTLAEAEELISRLSHKKSVLPLITSCCPAWVAYAEFYHPELLPHLTSVRSPQIIQAGAIKTYWAEKEKVAPENIIVVSIMPCTSKKYEAARPELTINGHPLVDHVLTTREFAFLLKKNQIDFRHLQDYPGDSFWGKNSGAAAIYGASGGVMESALRTAADLLGNEEGKVALKNLEFKTVRGLSGFKEAVIKIGKQQLKVGVVNGIGNLPRLLPKLHNYHYIEVMACPGGCLAGGGQPLTTTDAVRRQRSAGLYKIDKKRPVRLAHHNGAMLEYYDWVKKNRLSDRLLHTKYKKALK